jgi:hypothetical protein
MDKKNLIPVWTPNDFDAAVRDAQAVVESGKRRLRIVNEHEYLPPAVLFTQSRERKARIMDGLAVFLLMLLCAVLGCIALILATPAKADVDNVVFAYSAHYGGAVCSVLDEFPSENGILGIGASIMEDGLTGYQAGQVIYLSVSDICPRHMGLIRAFAYPEVMA